MRVVHKSELPGIPWPGRAPSAVGGSRALSGCFGRLGGAKLADAPGRCSALDRPRIRCRSDVHSSVLRRGELARRGAGGSRLLPGRGWLRLASGLAGAAAWFGGWRGQRAPFSALLLSSVAAVLGHCLCSAGIFDTFNLSFRSMYADSIATTAEDMEADDKAEERCRPLPTEPCAPLDPAVQGLYPIRSSFVLEQC